MLHDLCWMLEVSPSEIRVIVLFSTIYYIVDIPMSIVLSMTD